MASDRFGRVPDLADRLHPLDHSLEHLPVTGHRPDAADWRPRHAAVLVAVLDRGEPEVVLTVRSHRMPRHAGQIAFPGGNRGPGEAFPLDTALREAHEEVGLHPDDVQPVGIMDCFDTITGYRVVPVVARARPSGPLRPCPDEVEEIFTIPLQRIVDPRSYREHDVVRGSRSYTVTSLAHDQRLIWGATAAMLRRLGHLLDDAG